MDGAMIALDRDTAATRVALFLGRTAQKNIATGTVDGAHHVAR
jgi:hypothetical protein